MTFLEFQQLQGQVWLNITTPTDPFVRRTYELVSGTDILEQSERVGGHIFSRYRVIRHMSVDFTERAGSSKDNRVIVWPAGKKTVIPSWDVKHAKVPKRIPSSFYQHVFTTIFVDKKGKIQTS